MKALVTGGAGFIGSHIVDRLLKDGHEVVVLDDFSTGHRSNLTDNEALEIVEGDISNPGTVKEIMPGIDWVFHKAAVASVPKTVNDPVGSSAVNYQGTLQLLEAARNNNVKRFVFASSAALYGDEPTLPKVETMCPVTLSPYAVDKLASEFACGMYTSLYGLETVCLRYFNVFGPRQDPASQYAAVIPIFISNLLEGKSPTIYGDGEQSRDFTYVGNIVKANILAAHSDKAAGQVVNVACGGRFTLNELYGTLCEMIGVSIDPVYADPRLGDVKHSHADISMAEELLGYSVDTDFKEGTHLFRYYSQE